MTNWAKLRDASMILKSSAFEGSRQDLKRIFDLLDVDGSETLSLKELVRARILTKGEANTLLDGWYHAFNANQSGCESGKREGPSLTFNEFCRMTQKHLHDKYAQKDTHTHWEQGCRSHFRASRARTAMIVAEREGKELLPNIARSNSDSPTSPALGLKAVSAGVKAARAFGFAGACRDHQEDAGIVMAC